MRPDGKIRDDLTQVDVVDRDVIRSEVRNIQARVVGGNHAPRRFVAHQITSRNLVGRSFDHGNAARLEIERHQFPAIGLQRQAYRRLSGVEKCQQLVVLNIDARNLPRSRTGNERLAGIGQNSDVFRLHADIDGRAHGKPRAVDDGDAVGGAIGDDDSGSIGRNASQAGSSANVERRRKRAPVKIEHRNTVGAGIGHVSAVSVGRNVDKVRTTVDADGGNDLILLGVNHADVRRAGVDDINFSALRIGRESGGLVPHLQGAHRAKAAEVDHCDGVALPIRDVSIFAVERAVSGESALVEVVPAGGEDERDENGDEEGFAQDSVRRSGHFNLAAIQRHAAP